MITALTTILGIVCIVLLVNHFRKRKTEAEHFIFYLAHLLDDYEIYYKEHIKKQYRPSSSYFEPRFPTRNQVWLSFKKIQLDSWFSKQEIEDMATPNYIPFDDRFKLSVSILTVH